jgi:hypothetical protein
MFAEQHAPKTDFYKARNISFALKDKLTRERLISG